MTAENGVVERLRGQVLGALSEHQRADQISGRPRLRAADEQALGRQLIADALDGDAREALAAGRLVRPTEEDDALTQAVFDALFRLGRLQRLLDDSSVENINANGADQVWVRYADWVDGSGAIPLPPRTRSWSSWCETPRRASGSANGASTWAHPACRCSCRTGPGCSR